MDKEAVTTEDLAIMVKDGFDGVSKDMKEVKDRLTKVETSIVRIDLSIVRMDSSMVTKTYLDEKLGAHKGNLVGLVPKKM